MTVNSSTNEKEGTAAGAAETAAGVPVAETESGQDLAGKVAALTAERDRIAAEKAELYDRFVRRQAEFENFRKRVEREKGELIAGAGMELTRQLLPILDDFERAITHEISDAEYAKGIELIYQRLFETLTKAGLEPIATEGQKFDPYVHHAMEMVETDEVEDHTILAELLRGYNFRGKLLRPAMVRVAVAPSSGK
jgi:molecular chaperone GrpE